MLKFQWNGSILNNIACNRFQIKKKSYKENALNKNKQWMKGDLKNAHDKWCIAYHLSSHRLQFLKLHSLNCRALRFLIVPLMIVRRIQLPLSSTHIDCSYSSLRSDHSSDADVDNWGNHPDLHPIRPSCRWHKSLNAEEKNVCGFFCWLSEWRIQYYSFFIWNQRARCFRYRIPP